MAIRKGNAGAAPVYLPGPAGNDGKTGAAGGTGAAGPAGSLAVGTVTTGAPGAPAAATVTGSAPNQILNLTIPQGAPGAVAPKGSVIAAEAIAAGQAVCVAAADGKLYLARADIFARARALGLARAATAPGFACDVEGNVLTLSDWTAIAGVAALVPGLAYFLSPTPGQLTTLAPTAVGQSVTRLGVAVTAATLAIDTSAPILL